MGEEYILETKNLCFKDMITYNDISIPKGKVTFITGESGSGKSTLLKLFNGTLTQSRGEIYYNKKNTSMLDSILLRTQISLISQNVFLFRGTIKDNFKQFYEYREQPIPSHERINQFLRICCIPFPLQKDCTTMSGGERQRIYIAIFLSFIPRIIMLDEPTSALDSKNTIDMFENILQFSKENDITLIVVSHDKGLTKNYAECNIVLERGDNDAGSR